MRKRIVIAFALIFALFTLGSGVTIYYLITTTSNLRSLISLHEIEDIRQSLGFSIQKIRTYTYAPADEFAKNLDEVIINASVVDGIIDKCHECHHTPDVTAELNQTKSLISDYQERLSYLVTTITEGERRRQHQQKVSRLSDIILAKVQDMVSRAAASLTMRTEQATFDIERSYIFMALTLILTFLAAFFIARSLKKRITEPIDKLLTATQIIADGELGYQTMYHADPEFNRLINTFNEMSSSLAGKEQKIKNNLARLNQLHLVTLPLHTAQDMSVILNYLRTCMLTLVDVEMNGIMLLNEQGDNFTLDLLGTANNRNTTIAVTLEKEKVHEVFHASKGQPFLKKTGDNTWPFGSPPADIVPKNILIHWLRDEKKLTGGLFFINKADGDFQEEDLKILGILANNITVALENIRLYKDLQLQMDKLKKTQRQLVEAEKLTALGTLAGGVAHDFNNILCGMIGYVALLKKNHTPDERDYKMLDTIEKAGFRAANLIKQLLTFARQEMISEQLVNLNDNANNVIAILRNTISKMIIIRPDLAPDLPLIMGDPAQLEQVIMNLCVNARDAMPEGGELRITTEKISFDHEFCKLNPGTTAGDYVRLTVSDQGIGIDKDTIPRIFEPFFTTKEIGKGTGLGLAMVYGIVKSHQGFCQVASEPDQGTVFSVNLPVATKTGLEKPTPAPVKSELTGRHTILIVDDEDLVVNTVSEYLKEIGCTVLLAENGQAALDLLGRHRDEVDLVILDINMPVMDGKEAYGKMMAIKPGLKVLIATGYALQGTAKEIMDSGAQGFIQKPYSLDDIGHAINQILQGEIFT